MAGTVVAVLLVVALVGTAVALMRRDDESATPTSTTRAPRSSTTHNDRTDPDPSEPDPSAPDPADPEAGTTGGFTSDPETVRQEVASLRRFVESKRGLTYERDVEVTVLAPEAFKAEVRKAFNSDSDKIRTEGELLRAAGLVPPTFDIVTGQLQLIEASALGFYDTKSKRLVVRGGGRFTPFVRRTLVHELTHALDDQRLNLTRPEIEDAKDGRAWAFLALAEGSARRVENLYVDQLSEGDVEIMDAEMMRLGLEQLPITLAIPKVLPRIQMSPYEYGEPFVTKLVEKGGTGAVDEAMRNPPVSSEHVLDDAKFRAREAPLPVARPPIEGTMVNEGSLGELHTALLLHGAETNAGGGIDPSGTGFTRLSTVKGWGGDHFVVYRPPAGGVCMRADWKMDSPTAREDMLRALQAWAATDRLVQVSQPDGELVRAARCAPAS